ncbi:MAG TPA: chemotaxis protein CheB [Thermoanaerobaculia bacterium]|nr:chemotaxis protein CheB [Thermoanaerobaculia bacterium]
MNIEMIVIGTSLGGLRALQRILEDLPPEFSTPIAAVQHRHKSSQSILAQHLQRSAKIRVRDAENRMPIDPGTLYLAPADYHLMVENGRFLLSTDDAVQYSRPSIDVLFESAADAYRDNLLGIVLTGANNDGSSGAEAIKRRGGTIIVQDPEEAEAPTMPLGVIARIRPDRVLKLAEIGPWLNGCCHVDAGKHG